ncbi:MAG: septum formation initiator family protein [Candidatus Omnitrophica bacterium]|nr:septum formation initiator family protein [Candidatus Omnitrophota bacterium]
MFFKKVPQKFILGTILVLILFIPGFIKIGRLILKSHRLEKEIGRLKKENTSLSQEVYRLQNDPVYLEKVAREEMRLGKEGEIIYKTPPSSKK